MQLTHLLLKENKTTNFEYCFYQSFYMYVKLCYFLDSVSSQWNQQQYNCVKFKKSRSQYVSLTEKVLQRNDIIKLNDSQVGFV